MKKNKNVLVTGGSGYIGSHTLIALIESGYFPVVVDNFSNSSKKVFDKLEKITGKRILFYDEDILNTKAISKIIKTHSINSVLHFAGLKSVAESIDLPLEYYQNNVNGTLSLLAAMKNTNIKSMVFSSSATVYGDQNSAPYSEDLQRGRPMNPYGSSKAMIEQILEDLCVSDRNCSVIALRYFNPAGAHPSGLIGENPQGIPNNLMPYISQVGAGKLKELSIFGNDYPTPDGTCQRDYIHVMDIAYGHLKALNYNKKGFLPINLGTGKPTSVIEMIKSFCYTTGVEVPYKFSPRRQGDLPAVWADIERAKELISWKAERTLDDIMCDAWNWQQNSNNDD